MAHVRDLAGRRILLAEDDFFIADDFAAAFKAMGAEVVGPVASLAEALELVQAAERLDGAVLDINLQGHKAYPLVDALRARAVPVVFATGYDCGVIPARYADVPVCEKPIQPSQVAAALFGLERVA